MGVYFVDPTFTGPLGLFEYADTITGGWFIPGLMVTIFFFTLLGLGLVKLEHAFTAASFVTLIVGVLFSVSGLLDPSYIPIIFGVLVVSFLLS